MSQWLFYGLGILVGALIVLALLDATVGRWLIGRYATTFRKTLESGEAPESGRLMVYLPGILFDGDESVAEIKDAMLQKVAAGLFISYGFWRFMPNRVLDRTAQAIGHAPPENSDQRYHSIVIVGASFGGRLAADLSVVLQTQYGWKPSEIKLIMVDTPCENNSFQTPGLTLSLILRRVYIGPLVSLAVAPLLKRGLVPPYEVDMDPEVDFAETKRKTVERMAKFRLSGICDQQRYLADNSVQWTMGLAELEIVYLWCAYHNITVVQPAAMRKVQLYTRGKGSHFSWLAVPSPHCGFAQMPLTWSETFLEVLSEVPSHRFNHN